MRSLLDTYALEITLALVLLHEAGKVSTHVWYRHEEAPWAHRPLIPGLQITDWFHVFSAAMWPAVFWVCYLAWDTDWRWWAAAVAGWQAAWTGIKRISGKPWPGKLTQILNLWR